MKPGRDAAQRWLRQAEHDLRIAGGHHERADYSDACFMAEQAAQKALKAFLIRIMTRPDGNAYARMQNKAGNYLTPDGQIPSRDLSSQQVRIMTHIELGP
jgi:HEPN domain-containing protein